MASEEELDERQEKAKRKIEHAGMSWTASYDEGCFMQLSEKQGRWFPREPKGYASGKNLPYAT